MRREGHTPKRPTPPPNPNRPVMIVKLEEHTCSMQIAVAAATHLINDLGGIEVVFITDDYKKSHKGLKHCLAPGVINNSRLHIITKDALSSYSIFEASEMVLFVLDDVDADKTFLNMASNTNAADEEITIKLHRVRKANPRSI